MEDLKSQIPFYDRRGVLVAPLAHSVVRKRQGVWAVARAVDSVLVLWPECAKGVPDLPGGGVDEGESLEQAVAREFYEETGLDFVPLAGPLGRHHHVRGFYAEDQSEFWIYDQTFFLYEFGRTQEIGRRWRNPEGDEVAWMRFEDLPMAGLNRAHWLGVQALMRDFRAEGVDL